MRLLVSDYSEYKRHEPYFYTDKQLPLCTISNKHEWDEIPFFLLKKAGEADAGKYVEIILKFDGSSILLMQYRKADKDITEVTRRTLMDDGVELGVAYSLPTVSSSPP
jgi:hypothetical protein